MNKCDDIQTLSAADVLHAIQRIATAETIECVWARTIQALGRLGFERVNYGFTRYYAELGIGDPKDAFFLSTHALDKVIAFHTSGHYLHSPEYRWVRENVGSSSWGFLKNERSNGRLSKSEELAMDSLGAKRERAGYSISFAETQPRSKGAMGLAAPSGVTQDALDRMWTRRGIWIEALCNTAHLKLSQMPLPVPNVELSQRQREVLDWVADGKTLQDVAVLTGLSVSAVEKHLRRARGAMGVETTAQAVAKASFFNQLFATRNRSEEP